MKAWQRELKIIQEAKPFHLADDNETFWEEQSDGPELAQDAQARLWWHSQVPGSQAHESIMTAAIQATENKGMIVENSEALIEKGLKAYDENDTLTLNEVSYEVWEACRNAKEDSSSPYWNQTFYDTFEDYEKKVNFPEAKPITMDEAFEEKIYSGWLGQIIGGAYGTCIEGYTSKNLKEFYGTIDKYVRKPNTYNDDITYELALLEAYVAHGKETTAKDISDMWLKHIITGWSAEEMALRNLRCGILPPESGRFNNPFNEWIGAQMRGAILGQLYPGNVKEAARAAWMDASISHNRNGILGEVFNAIMTSMAFVEEDIHKIIEDAVNLMPEDSEYGQVVRFALEQCKNNTNHEEAWAPCEEKYQRYNWIHAYPNAAAEIVALWFGDKEMTKTLSICGACGQDVDCNAAQVMTIVGTMIGRENFDEYWTAPFGEEIDTYVRGMKKLNLKDLVKKTSDVARTLASI